MSREILQQYENLSEQLRADMFEIIKETNEAEEQANDAADENKLDEVRSKLD